MQLVVTVSSHCSWSMTISSASRAGGNSHWTGRGQERLPRVLVHNAGRCRPACYADIAPGETETTKHRRRLAELAAAGCYQLFVGIESLDPDNLNLATKDLTDFRTAPGWLLIENA
jgi:hypothetical protein